EFVTAIEAVLSDLLRDFEKYRVFGSGRVSLHKLAITTSALAGAIVRLKVLQIQQEARLEALPKEKKKRFIDGWSDDVVLALEWFHFVMEDVIHRWGIVDIKDEHTYGFSPGCEGEFTLTDVEVDQLRRSLDFLRAGLPTLAIGRERAPTEFDVNRAIPCK